MIVRSLMCLLAAAATLIFPREAVSWCGSAEQLAEQAQVVFTGELVEARVERAWVAGPSVSEASGSRGVGPDRIESQRIWIVEVHQVYKGEVPPVMRVKVVPHGDEPTGRAHPGEIVFVASVESGPEVEATQCLGTGLINSRNAREFHALFPNVLYSHDAHRSEQIRRGIAAAPSDTFSVVGPLPNFN